jgi:hypothetical protein
VVTRSFVLRHRSRSLALMVAIAQLARRGAVGVGTPHRLGALVSLPEGGWLEGPHGTGRAGVGMPERREQREGGNAAWRRRGM